MADDSRVRPIQRASKGAGRGERTTMWTHDDRGRLVDFLTAAYDAAMPVIDGTKYLSICFIDDHISVNNEYWCSSDQIQLEVTRTENGWEVRDLIEEFKEVGF